MSKRFLICAAAVLLALCLTAGAGAEDVTAGAEIIEPTSTRGYTANVPGDGEMAYFVFTPSVSGTYQLRSVGQNDTYAYLYDASLNELAHDDDSGDNTNFLISYYMEAGERYYFGVRFYDEDSAGEITVHFTKTNNLQAWSVSSTWPRTETPDEVVDLAVQASCDEGGLTFVWTLENGEVVTAGVTTTADSSTLRVTVPATTGYMEYGCTVTDETGDSRVIYFHPAFGNGFDLTRITNSSVYAAKGYPVSLRVEGHCNLGVIHYQWLCNGDPIEGATQPYYITPPITEYAEYTCHAHDDYGNGADRSFTILIDNGFYIRNRTTTRKVAAGTTETLNVEAYVDEGDLTYSWKLYTEGDDVTLNEAGPLLTTAPITEWCSYSCTVTDMYGNSRSVAFTFEVDNGFQISGERYRDVEVLYGEDLTLTVEASCLSGGLEYVWTVYSDGDEVDEEWPDLPTLTLENVTEDYDVRLEVNDDYGNHGRVSWSVYVDAGLWARPTTGEVVFAQPGAPVTLGVEAGTTHGQIAYRWTAYDGNGTLGTDSTYTVEDITQSALYWCEVSNGLGQSAGIRFIVLAEQPTVLTQDAPVTYTVTRDTNRVRQFTFTPSATGTYVFKSVDSADADPYVTLYDQNGQELGGNDDAGRSLNFALSRELTAHQTYTFIVSTYSLGDVTVLLTTSDNDVNLPDARNEASLTLRVGQQVRFPARAYHTQVGEIAMSPTNVLSRSGEVFTAVHAGTADVYVYNEAGSDDESFWTVWHVTVVSGAKVIAAPSRLTTIEAGAFAGDASIRFAALGSNVVRVEAGAFADTGLIQISVSSGITRFMGGSVFGTDAVILCPEGSLAEAYARQYGYTYAYND